MNLYHKLFGINLMAPAEDGEGGGAAADRGDTLEQPGAAPENEGANEDDDLKIATGESESSDENDEEQPRDEKGKFTKKDKDEDDKRIPKAEFDRRLAKERDAREAVERQLAEMQKQTQREAKAADIGKLEAEVKELRSQERKALIAGDDAKAAELSEKADRLNRQIAIEEAKGLSAKDKDAAREEIRMELTVERLLEEHPELDDNAEEFDQDVSDRVLRLQAGYMNVDGLNARKALLRAVADVFGERAAKAAEKDVPKADPNKRKEAAVAKNIEASARQPASTKKVGADSDKFGQNKSLPEAEAMTYEEFSALPEATKAKMRGDFA